MQASGKHSDTKLRASHADAPRGPYYDKDGLECTTYNAAKKMYGCSMLLGPDENQLVPGHPHFWQEGATTYMGYDFRERPSLTPDEPEYPDAMAIRILHFVNGRLADSKSAVILTSTMS